MFAIHAHVFQIDPRTKKKWIPSSGSAVRVAFYHDPSRGTYRIIAIETNKVGQSDFVVASRGGYFINFVVFLIKL